jgi:hypothetical protein
MVENTATPALRHAPGRAAAKQAAKRAAKRGGAVSAGAIVALLAGGSFAVAGSGGAERDSSAGLASTVESTTSALLPKPLPQAQPQKSPGGLGGIVGTVTDTVDSTLDTVGEIVTEPAPEPTDDPTTAPPTKPGPGVKPPGVVDKPTKKPVKPAAHTVKPAQRVHVTRNARPGSAADLRAGVADTAGSFGEQQTNASVTPRLAPGTFDGLVPAPDLGSRGVPGVLIIIATAGLAALGATHLGVWYNRRVVSAS